MTLAPRTDSRRRPALLDPGSFVPIRTRDPLACARKGRPGDGVIAGEGRIDGRRVFVYEQDPSVMGGSLGEAHADSMCRVLDLAGRFGAPVDRDPRSPAARASRKVSARSPATGGSSRAT